MVAIRKLARRVLRAGILVLQALERALGTPEIVASEQKATVEQAMAAHDMVLSPDESYYRDRYLELISPALDESALGGLILDAACGSGRLLLPLAEAAGAHGGKVIGVDYLGSAVHAARQNAAAAGLNNIELVEADLVGWLRDQPDASLSAAVFLEAGYVMPQLDEALAELARVVAPGGRLFASLRSRRFVTLLGVRLRRWSVVRAALGSNEGELEGLGWQRWHDPADAIAALTAVGFGEFELTAIGSASGIEGDPFAAFARPSELNDTERENLAALERRLGPAAPDAGRYLFVSARRLK